MRYRENCTAGQVTYDNVLRRMRFGCWATKDTNTFSECVILSAIPRQQPLRERTSVLCYTYSTTRVLHICIYALAYATVRHFMHRPTRI